MERVLEMLLALPCSLYADASHRMIRIAVAAHGGECGRDREG